MDWVARWFSYLGGIALIFMAIAAFVNVIASKVFGKAINNVNEIIDYLLIAVVYCCAADCQLNGGGLIQVDIFFRMFPYGMKKVIKASRQYHRHRHVCLCRVSGVLPAEQALYL